MEVPLGKEADAELDAEVDAEPDEQRDEGDRDQVEAAGHQQPEGSRHDQAHEGGQQDRCHDAARMNGPPQDPQQRDHHGGGDQVPILRQRRELLVGQRHRPGQADADAVGVVEAKRAGRRADRVARRLAGLQGGEVHHRLDDEDAPRLAPDIRRPHDVLPGEEGGLSRRRLVEGIGECQQQRLERVELRLAVLDALEEARHGGQHAAQRWIGRQRRQQGLRARQAFDRRLNLRN